MGAKANEALIERFMLLATKALGTVRVGLAKDADTLQNELKND